MKSRSWNLLFRILLYAIVLIMLLPVIWLIITAIRPEAEIDAKPPVWLPSSISVNRILSLFKASHMEHSAPVSSFLYNSILTAILSSFISLILGTLAGYAFARLQYKYKKHVFLSFMLLRATPGIALSLPLFIIFARLRIIDTILGLVLVYTALSIPFTAWLMTGFFRDIPQEMVDSSQIDGCSRLQSLWHIDIPMARPGLSASWVFVFITCWNEFQIANVLTRTLSSKTFPVGLFDFTAEFTINWQVMAAMSVVMLIPSFIFILLIQQNLARGLTIGAIKG